MVQIIRKNSMRIGLLVSQLFLASCSTNQNLENHEIENPNYDINIYDFVMPFDYHFNFNQNYTNNNQNYQ